MGFDQFSPKSKREDMTLVGTGTFGADQGFSDTANAIQAFFGPVGKVGKKATYTPTLNFESSKTETNNISNLAPTVNVASGDDSSASASPAIGDTGGGGSNLKTIGLALVIGLIVWFVARKVKP
jgi:hypothetical protein